MKCSCGVTSCENFGGRRGRLRRGSQEAVVGAFGSWLSGGRGFLFGSERCRFENRRRRLTSPSGPCLAPTLRTVVSEGLKPDVTGPTRLRVLPGIEATGGLL